MPKPIQSPPNPSPPNKGQGLHIPVRSLLAFFTWFILIFVVLLLLWSPLGNGYGRLFRTAGNVFVGVGSQGRVWFERPDPPDAHHDTRVVVIEPKERVKRTTQTSSRRHGYMPTAFLMALTLATPVAWPRRLGCTMWALLWVNLYVGIKLTLFPMAYGSDDPAGVWSLAGILRWMFWVVGASSVGWMLVPLLIWAILASRVLIEPRSTPSC